MIIKKKDALQPQIDELSALLALALPDNKRILVEKELKVLRSGAKGEKDSAYYIDFQWRDSKNWAVLHDLRLEHRGHVAQIDHLLINRHLEIFVLESKHYRQGLTISELGEFSFFFNGRAQAIPSPIEQNKRHITFLERYLKNQPFMPKRLGITMSPVFKNFILVSPESKIVRPLLRTFDTSMVIKSDMLHDEIEKYFESVSLESVLALGRLIGQDTLQNIARSLALQHRPASIDYRKKFAIRAGALSDNTSSAEASSTPTERTTKPQRSREASHYFCAKCKKGISKKVALFCFQNKGRFSGKAYCFDCQRALPA